MIRNWLSSRRNRWARVEIECPHGAFIPATTSAQPGKSSRFGCGLCAFHIRITFYAGERHPESAALAQPDDQEGTP